MTDRPILFSAPMVRALLAGTKTQTRRILKPQPDTSCAGFRRVFKTAPYFEARNADNNPIYPFKVGKHSITPYPTIRFDIGDLLWVRESWQLHSRATDLCTVAYMASVNHAGWTEAHEQFPDNLAGAMRPKPFQEGWRPSIHMQRWASRLTLTVTDVRVECLQDISEEDAVAEGIWQPAGPEIGWGLSVDDDAFWWTAKQAYRVLWNNINGAGAWEKNPWVCAISFSVEKRNIDQ